MMGSSAQESWEGDLRGLKPTHYLKTGVVPWQAILMLLALWTVFIVGRSIWLAFTKRWAPTLGGFELFKFGADFNQEVNDFGSLRFEKCEPLRAIPGMVGALPGNANGGDEGFIRLSENFASSDGTEQ